ncbi:hypothetical protein ILUMI_02436 [Ignelater luminosus]|uniref:Isoleucine--tRNA ligase, cytoplasmic n=1 Tax=Ignelater luminosus TaxID=2038154 RepID=A0A8K0DCQ2_IGNLU|nr:hypothetical protein ILUMI_02436 [Ignelater luminosus]
MAYMIQEIPRITECIDFPSEELKILSLWKQLDVFHNCLKQSEGKPRYSFYDGPPFATGLPHYGHILAGTIKDIVTRYAHQQGFHVERRFGWDCHGLPVEFEIDKKFNIKGPEDVEKMGVDIYNAECRSIVTHYVTHWKLVMGKIGRWIDFDNDYKTLYPWFMESVWWVFKQLYLKGLVYHGNKVMPYSTSCHTPLSNFESGQNYKEVIDPAVTVSLPIIGDMQGASMLIWTTTPWTLPSNLAACVNSKLIYARIKEKSTNRIYVLLKSRADFIFKPECFEILEEFLGENLKDVEYEPIFPYYAHMRSKGAFRVLTDEYVTAESGTGIVHQAPYFGEDDFRCCLAAGIITLDQEPICPVDSNGCLTKPVVDFEGQYFKDADRNIVVALKAKNRLVLSSQVKHSYPFCWRSDTPLIYKAIPSWFIRVQHMSELLQKCSSEIYWIPDFVKEKRFSNWLKEARDWAVSRNRYWGTPIPIWTSADGDEIYCVGSIKELEELTGKQIKDLHRESIDHLEIPSSVLGRPPLRRIPEVFDCWFESGSMPYAQQHFPFENHKEFSECFPADFIAEGIDQTRGWFYTLLVISTALFGKAPFKNLISSGLILASDGQKMSKRKNNYPDPMEIVSKYGADALRLYLINSPVVRAENLRFKEEGVRDIIKDVFLPWFNSFRFLIQNIEMFVNETSTPFYYKDDCIVNLNIMDRWILSFTQSLLQYVHKEMKAYHLYNVVPRLTKYFDHLTNWYVRMNRKRLKGETKDQYKALMTLFNCLRKFIETQEASIHYLMLPQANGERIDKDIERIVFHLQEVVEIGRILRDRKNMPLKYPLPEIIIIHQDNQYLSDIKSVEQYLLTEMNVRKVTLTVDKDKFGIKMQAKPDYKTLGVCFKSNYKSIAQTIESLTDNEINSLIAHDYVDVKGIHIEKSFVRLSFKTNLLKTHEMHAQGEILVLLDTNPDKSMLEEGAAREIINRIQKLRKQAHLVPSDKICVYYKATKDLANVAEMYTDFIEKAIKTDFLPLEQYLSGDQIVAQESREFKGCCLKLLITQKIIMSIPVVRWANLLLQGFGEQSKGLILLEAVNEMLTFHGLQLNVRNLFDMNATFTLWNENGEITNDSDVVNHTSGNTIYVLPRQGINEVSISYQEYIKLNGLKRCEPFCKVLNFCEQGVVGTIVLENPAGVVTVTEKDYQTIIDKWLWKAI